MKPKFYLDIDLRLGTQFNAHDTMSFAVQKLHYTMKDRKCALGFPTIGGHQGLGKKIRVFSETSETLSKINFFLQKDWRMVEHFAIQSIKNVPSEVTEYEAYYRFRLSHSLSLKRENRLKSLGLAEKFTKRNETIREKQFSQLQEAIDNMGFATIYSHSTGRQFKLYIIRKKCESICQGEPDAYGLSRKNQVIALPVLP